MQAVVIGAGLSGLTAAYRLQQAGVKVQVIETSAGPGGRIQALHRDGFILDRGADALAGGYHRYFELVREFGLGDQLVPVSAPVGTVRGGAIITIDGSVRSLISTRLLSKRAKLKLVRGAIRLFPILRRVDTTALYGLAEHDSPDRTARTFSERWFGSEATDYLIEPMVRMFGGSPAADASAVDVLSGLALAGGTPHALRGGLYSLVEALAAKVDVRFRTEVLQVRETGERAEVDLRLPTGDVETVEADGCVLATMFEPAAAIYPPLAAAAGTFASELSYMKLLKVQLAYAEPTACDAFMVQVPVVEDRDLMGIFLDHNKCADRAPAGHSLLSVYMGTATSTVFMDRTDEELVAWARGKVAKLFPELRADPLFTEVTRWPLMGNANTPGYYRRAAEVVERLGTARAVQPAGDWFTKTSQEAAITAGERAADNLLSRWEIGSTRPSNSSSVRSAR